MDGLVTNGRLSNVSQIVWSIVSFSEGADVRDGAENSANGLISGWFYSRINKALGPESRNRLRVLRHKEARQVVDVKVFEKGFASLTEFTAQLSDVQDFRLPTPHENEERTFGQAEYPMVKIPRPEDYAVGEGDRGHHVWVGVAPVTNAQYKRFCDASGHRNPGHWAQEAPEPATPVVDISIEDALAFCEWAELELPNASLWKRVALAGSSGRYWWGNDEDVVNEVAWYDLNSEGRLRETCLKPANTWGLYDILGNVWEWAMPFEKEEGRNKDPRDKTSVRRAVAYGGAYDTPSDELDGSTAEFAVKTTSPKIGFRCVVSTRQPA